VSAECYSSKVISVISAWAAWPICAFNLEGNRGRRILEFAFVGVTGKLMQG
jgi:hypothetical protein